MIFEQVFTPVTISFSYDKADFELNLPRAILDNKLNKARKLFRYMCSSNDAEHDAAKKTAAMLFMYVDFTFDEYKQAAKTYADEYEAPEFITDIGKKAEAEKKNKKLKSIAGKAKQKFESAVKLRQEFVSIYTKFNKQ